MNEQQAKRAVKRWWRRRWVTWTAALLLIAALTTFAVLQYLVRHAEPILRRRVVDTISARFHSPVQLDQLRISVIQGLQVSGKGLRIESIAGPAEPSTATPQLPMLSINSFQFHIGLSGLLHSATRVVTVYVQGMRIDIPPSQNRGPIVSAPSTHKGKQPKISLILDRIICSDTTLILEANKPGKIPLQFDIANLTLYDVGTGKPLNFDATLLNPKPIGDIRSTGHFGPWDDEDPRSTHVDGTYSFTRANLDSIKGIGGWLSSSGRYAGPLEQLTVDGTTDTPDFSVDTADHSMPLHTEFHAFVDGTTGDTTLSPVHATLGHSSFTASGTIAKVKEGDQSIGHDISLEVVMDKGARIEDMLQLAIKQTPPLMRGGFAMHTRLHIPPGNISVSQKIQLNGTFAIQSAIFSNPHFQEKVDTMSERAQGGPKQANPQDVQVVASTMQGHFIMGNRLVKIDGLHYQMPGALVLLDGQYGLDGETFDFHGVVRTSATISHMTTGWKSLALKLADPFFKKNGAGAQIPIKIVGTKSDPQFGLDFHHKNKEENAPGLPPSPK